jgi:SAM-dependent methyltransferase
MSVIAFRDQVFVLIRLYIHKIVQNPFIREPVYLPVVALAKIRVKNPIRVGSVRVTEGSTIRIFESLIKLGFQVDNYYIDIDDYNHYIKEAKYKLYPLYFSYLRSNFAEKTLEHYLSYKLLELSHGDVYIDVASRTSPTADIYKRLIGCQTYRQDLAFPEGVHGDTIGGNAAKMPLPDGFATKMALHCSFEHFEENSDVGFIREAGRVLRSGGRMCILPLYLSEEYTVQTDPLMVLLTRVKFEEDATVAFSKGSGPRYSRFYDIPHLISRIRNNLGPLSLRIIYIENAKEVHSSVCLRFAAIFERL